jgi:hypothetical protein
VEIEFDKEIDAILRGAAKGSSSVNLSSEHLDADEISSFAENVLPANARLHAMEHLADCYRCRKILIETSAFVEDETASEIVHSIETKNEIPWYKKLFTFPNLAYSLGAACVVFAGIIGFAVFQNKSSLDDVAILEEKQTNSKSASSDGIEQMKEVLIPNSNATAVSNTVANTTNLPNLPKTSAANSVVAANTVQNLSQPAASAPAIVQPNTPKNQTAERPRVNGEVSATPAKQTFPMAKSAESEPNTSAGTALNSEKNDAELSEAKKKVSQDEMKPGALADSDKVKVEDGADVVTRSAPKAIPPAPSQAPMSSKRIAVDNKSESKQVSGKTFRRIGGTWFDSAYGSQPQTNVSRGSADYKKLDDGLQNIGNSLSGNVVVLWKGKAYKIQ